MFPVGAGRCHKAGKQGSWPGGRPYFWRCSIGFGGAAGCRAALLRSGAADSRLIEKYITTTSGYLYATVNAFNWFAALGGNWTPLDDSLLGPVTWGMAGAFNIVLVTAAMVLLG
mgnify:CR=1 FL=1